MEITAKQHLYNFFKYVTKEKKDVRNIYFYAILSGLVQLSVPLGIQSIVSFVMGATMATSIYILIGFVVLGTWLAGFFRLKVMQIIEKIQQKIFVEFSLAFAEKLPKVNLGETRKYYLPELVNRFFDTQNLQKGISKILLEIPTALIQILFGILLLSFYHPWFLVFGAVVIIIVIVIFRFTMDSGIKTVMEESNRKYTVASWLEDIAASVKTFKINSKSKTHLSGVDERVVDYLSSKTGHFRILLVQFKTIITFKVIITLIMLVIGVYLLINQQLNIGAFIATEIVVLTIMAAVEKLIISMESYYDVIAALAKLQKITSLPEEENGEITLQKRNTGLEIEFQNVNFSFNEHQKMLHDLNFSIPENSITIISGNLGAGKSLLMNMIVGFYQPTSGTILYDKIPLKNINKEEIRAQTGLYLEDMTLLKGTIHDNIILGNEDLSTASILELADEIGISNISTQFIAGLDTPISETDIEVSYTTRKNILLLRSLIGKKRLYVLEDPLKGMNEEFENKMLKFLARIKNNATVIIVSQNTDLAELADQHLYLQNGELQRIR